MTERQDDILRGQGREFYQNIGKGNKNTPHRLEIVDKPASNFSNKSGKSELDNIIRFFRLQEELGPQGSEFIHELAKHNITTKEKDIKNLSKFILESTQKDPDPVITRKGGKKILGVPVGPERVRTVFTQYKPAPADGDPIRYERTTLVQRMLRSIFDR